MKSRISIALALLAALAIALPSATGQATHRGNGRTCPGPASTAALANPALGQDNVDDGEINKYKVVLSAGQTGYFMVQPLNGDIDVYVCKAGGGNEHACASPNMYPIGDGCHFEELDLYDPVLNIRIMDWGNALQQAGTYWIHVQQCWSSEDVPDGGAQGACDYATLLQPATTGGELDALPAVEYVYGWSVQ